MTSIIPGDCREKNNYICKMLNLNFHKVVIIVFFKINQFIFKARFVYKNVIILNLLCIFRAK